jgi:FkbM family methyltransferase
MLRRHILRTATPIERWVADHGDDTLAVAYPLDEGSTVFEVGGYRGKWASKIVRLYDPVTYIFEPVAEYSELLTQCFKENPKVKVFHYGLSDTDQDISISVDEDATSVFRVAARSERVILRDIERFAAANGIERIDLIQINIEGGEYQLLKRIVDSGLVTRCIHIQVQFHQDIPDAAAKRERIRERLAQTHDVLYDYPFVWEAWRLRNS